MATKKTTDTVDTTITNEEVVSAAEKKAEAKKASTKAKEANMEAAKKTAEAVEAVVKETAEKTKAKTKKAAKKTAEATKKTAASTKKAVQEKAEATKRKYTRKPVKTVVVQYMGQEISEAELTERALIQFAGTEGAVTVKTITLYIKPEDNAAYYVINDEFTGRIDF